MRRSLPWMVLGVAALSSCAKLATPKKEEPSPFGPTGVPPQLLAKTSDEGTPIIAGGNAPEKSIAAGITPDEDILYTDPDNPDAGIPELSNLLAAPKRGPWEESEAVAKQRSAREGKPLLIWFTDSTMSPMCKALSQELFSTSEFGSWATEKLVRLKIDAEVSKEEREGLSVEAAETRRIAIMNYNAAIKKRYKVLGYPSLIMLNPSGEVVGRYRGYKRGEADFLWGQLKHAEAVASAANKSWRANLEKKGYREWEDRKQRKVFARLVSYSKGTLTFIEPDGTRSRTTEDKLSDKDREWLAAQKKLRGL